MVLLRNSSSLTGDLGAACRASPPLNTLGTLCWGFKGKRAGELAEAGPSLTLLIFFWVSTWVGPAESPLWAWGSGAGYTNHLNRVTWAMEKTAMKISEEILGNFYLNFHFYYNFWKLSKFQYVLSFIQHWSAARTERTLGFLNPLFIQPFIPSFVKKKVNWNPTIVYWNIWKSRIWN